ncbi:MAG: hypothetical protein NTY61_01420 [Candidatus Parcubacteria bacterium]|nr:hypothetical protein [Candidatus Parcubacteria bacterium]
MVNFVPEDNRPKELPQKPASDDFEMEMIRPQSQPAKPSTPKKPATQSTPLVNPWIGGGIKDESTGNAVDLSQEGLTLDDGMSPKISSSEIVVAEDSLLKKRLLKIANKVGQVVSKIINSKIFAGSETVPRKKKMPISVPASSQAEVEVSLMPDEVSVTQRMVYERLLILSAVIAFLFLIVFLGWSWVNWRSEIAQTQINQVKVEMQATEGQVSAYNDSLQTIRLLAKKTDRAIGLLKDHVYWTNVFKLLEVYTIPDVYYPNFVAKVGDQIILPAVARDLTSVARQLAAFYSATDFIKDVTITDLVAGQEGVNFNINLTLDPSVLKK